MEQQPQTRAFLALEGFHFLASRITFYNPIDGRFEIASKEGFAKTGRVHTFFSRPYLQSRGWSVVPLWEGNPTKLLLDDRTPIPFMKMMCGLSLETGGKTMYTAALIDHRMSWQMNPAASVISLAAQKFDLLSEDPSDIFVPTPTYSPNLGGDNFLWPSNERFIMYSDMDDLSFVAGNKEELLAILGVSYDYCVMRVKRIHKKWLAPTSVITTYLNFCDELSASQT